MASSSKASVAKYDVFLSFRGEDTYKSFVSHLHTSLKSKGIYAAFKNDDDDERYISPEILNAIEESRFSIIIFSESYASSTRCLEELIKIMECVRYKGQIPIPVFSGVEPSDVRNQTNSFGESFAKHLENLKEGTADFQKVKMWTEALTQAASISGWDLRKTGVFGKWRLFSASKEADHRNDAFECIGLMVDRIFDSLNHPVSAAEKNLVGTETPIAVEFEARCSSLDPWIERFVERFTYFVAPAPQNEANKKWKYDAFLSFRGDDTRNNFVAHLYKRLEDIGINVFKDDVKLERGKFISTELSTAIEESRTAIIIFSEDYASSTWCLEELTMIMECVDKKEQKAYPVFYNVEPSDLRKKGENSSFAKALKKHVEDFKAYKPEADHINSFVQKMLGNKKYLALREEKKIKQSGIIWRRCRDGRMLYIELLE